MASLEREAQPFEHLDRAALPALETTGVDVGRALIDWLIAAMNAKHWAELYWITREDTYRARALYDTYTPHSGFRATSFRVHRSRSPSAEN